MAIEVTLSGDVGFEINANDIRIELARANGADIDFLLNSRGGLVFVGIEIFNLIRAYKGHTNMIITGIAASMGSYIALAANKVIAHDNTSFMIHNAMGIVLGNHNEMRERANALEGMSNILAKGYADKSGKTLSEVKALMDTESFFFGDEMREAGFVDEILDATDDNDQDKASALITTLASVDAVIARMNDSEAANADLDRAVAYVDSMSLLGEPKAETKDKNEPGKKKKTTDADDGGCGGGT